MLQFDRQGVIFALRSDEHTDFSSPTRTSDKLRTFFLANTENKILSGTINSSIMPATLSPPLSNRELFVLVGSFV